MPDPAPSPRTEVRRKPQRARYDRATIEAIVAHARPMQSAGGVAGG